MKVIAALVGLVLITLFTGYVILSLSAFASMAKVAFRDNAYQNRCKLFYVDDAPAIIVIRTEAYRFQDNGKLSVLDSMRMSDPDKQDVIDGRCIEYRQYTDR